MINYLPLLGIALVVLGFALRFNPLLVVAVAAIATGLLGGMPFLNVLSPHVGPAGPNHIGQWVRDIQALGIRCELE